jgi:methyl-accepting chemotaxis protein
MAARAELDGMLTQLDAEMGCLVGDLARGDFSQRILSQFDFSEVQSLADNIQAMADTMESFLKETAYVLTAMAEGDLRVEMTGEYTGEFDAVERSANNSIRQFRALIGEVQTTVAEGLEAVTRIGGSVADLAGRANEQVTAIQETAASMEQIATAVRTNTEAMVEADRMAQGVALSTQSGGVAARGAIAAVERIRDSSQEISDIVRVIETIAFQTTILALNSAIEAARAGEAGRGFSVVATEVRSLAQRSSDAAKQIKTLITSSEQMVMEGVEMVQSAGAALREIEDGIQSLSTRIAQVARSQIEQANAVSQVNANISSIESLAAESAALCADSGAETEGLSASMERVGAQMARFRVEGEAPAGARALPAPPSTAAAPKPSGDGADGPPPWVEDDETADWTVEDWARAAAG